MDITKRVNNEERLNNIHEAFQHAVESFGKDALSDPARAFAMGAQWADKWHQEKKKVMISQPMRGLTDEEIKNVRQSAKEALEQNGYDVIDSFFEGKKSEWANASHQVPVAYLSMSIAKMSECDAVYFCAGWSKMRGCKIEHQIAQEYGLEILGLPE